MSYIIKPTMTCILWKVLEKKLGIEVGGMINVDAGWIDLVARDPTGEYIGLVVKKDISGNSKKELKFLDQILKYITSGYFDYFYICIPKGGDRGEDDVRSLERILDSKETRRRYLSHLLNNPDDYYNFRMYSDHLSNCGILVIDEKWIKIHEKNIDFPDLIKRQPKRLRRYFQVNIPNMNKARIVFDVWNYYTKIENVLPIRNGVLPNLEGEEPRRIDIMIFKGETRANEILRNQEKFDLIGIETKSDLSSMKPILKQLNLYRNSGGLTRLYIAVPSKLEEDALSLLKDIPDVGLLTVDKKIVRIIREGKRLKMKYDAILYEKAGFQEKLGYPTRVSRRILEIGWGVDSEKYESIYSYQGKIH